MSKVTHKTISQQLAELDALVAWFDQANIDIDEALQKFAQATELAEAIKKHLAEAENKVEVLKRKFDQENA